jgi:hypothetical protein
MPMKGDVGMPSRRRGAAQIFDHAVDSLEGVTSTAGSKVKEGLDRAAEAVGASNAAERIVAKATSTRKATAKKAGGAKQVAKKRASATAKKAGGAKKVAKKRASATAKS